MTSFLTFFHRSALFWALILAPASAFGAGWENAPRAFVMLRDPSPAALAAFADSLEAAGGHASVLYSSGAAVVYGDDSILARGEIAGAITGIFRSELDPRAFETLDPGRRQAGGAWNAALALGDLDAGPENDSPLAPSGHPLPDAGPRPVALASRPALSVLDSFIHAPEGADYYDTSEFLAGRVAVGVWLLEDAGPGMVWSASEVTETLGGVQAGLDNWVRKGGAPAFLTFFVETHTNVIVSGTPIQNPISMDETWVNETLGNLGWTGANGFEKCFAYNNAIRSAYNSNWCYSIFIVDSNPNVNQGLFTGGGYAWAYFGGPWAYMSRVSTWAYNSTRYHAVVPMHETGHIFMVTDEYDGIAQYGGYLNTPDNDFTQCIMNQNDSTRVCQTTRNQLGWRDLDGDGIIEPLDVPPVTSLTPVASDPTTDATPTWSGRAQVATLANLNPLSNYRPPHDQTIAFISAVQGRADGGAWTTATASDGAFDGRGEDFTWTPAPLAAGTHVIEVRALTSVGNWSAAFGRDTLTVTSNVAVAEPTRSGAGLALFPPEPNPATAGALFRFTLPALGFVNLAIFGVDGRRLRMLLEGERPAGPGSLTWDGRDDAGNVLPPGVYLCRVRSKAGSVLRRLAVVR